MRSGRGIASGSRPASTRKVSWREFGKGKRRSSGRTRPSISRVAERSLSESAGISSRGRSATPTAASSTKRAALWRRAIPRSRRNAASRAGWTRSADSKTIPTPSGRHGGAGAMRTPTRSTASSANIASHAAGRSQSESSEIDCGAVRQELAETPREIRRRSYSRGVRQELVGIPREPRPRPRRRGVRPRLGQSSRA